MKFYFLQVLKSFNISLSLFILELVFISRTTVVFSLPPPLEQTSISTSLEMVPPLI